LRQGGRGERTVGGEVLCQECLDHLQGHRRQVVLSHRGNSLAEVLRLVRTDGVYGGEDVLGGGGHRVGGQQAAVVSHGRGGTGLTDRLVVVLDVRL